MKKFKKIASLVLAASMMAAMPVSMATTMVSYAGETSSYKLTINGTKVGHTYDVYQIYTGELSGQAGSYVLSNVLYGTNFGTANQKADETELATVKGMTGEAASDYFKDKVTGKAYKTVTSTNTTTVVDGLPAGYYLVKESTEDMPKGETATDFILQVVGDAEVQVKSGSTESHKYVKDINDSTDETVGAQQKSADYDIGDAVPFVLSATVDPKYDNYKETYVLNFHDVQSAGLDFNSASVVVKVDGTQITEGYTVNEDPTDGCAFEINFANLKDIKSVHAGSEITVDYTATLNEKAKIGTEGNTNTSHIEYSSNPNSDQKGTTPDETVIVFTYKVDVDKIDQDYKDLKGATFALYKKYAVVPNDKEAVTEIKYNNGNDTYDMKDAKYVLVNSIDGSDKSNFEFRGIDDGEYLLVETKTPEGYNSVDPVAFTVSAEHDDKTLSLTGLSVDNQSFKANKDGGSFEFTKADDTTKTHTVGTDNNKEAAIATAVVNNQGSTLPTTGGMGTTILYVAGAILVIAGAAVLVIKKRHEA